MKRPKYLMMIVLLIFCTGFILVTENRGTSYNMSEIDVSLVDEINLSRIYNITQDLSSYWTRLTGTFECDLAANYIWSTLNESLNVTNTKLEDWIYNEITSLNIVAEVNGTNLKQEIIILTAHYDSFSSAGSAPGANDNAVAVAVCMEIMRIIQNRNQLNRSLIFVSFAGEEQAFIGSKAWLSQHQDELPRIIGVINLDMIGYGDHLTLIKNAQSDWLADAVLAISSIVNISFSKTNSPYPENSRFEHDTFWSANIPAISIFEGGGIYPYYHTENDTIDKISFSLVEKCAQVTLLSVLYLGTVKYEQDWLTTTILIVGIGGISAIFPFLINKKLQ